MGEPSDLSEPRPPEPPEWLLRVVSPHSGAVHGGAALVAPALALTSAHVVNRALGREGHREDLPDAPVGLAACGSGAVPVPATAAAEYWFPGGSAQDLALLRVAGQGLAEGALPRLRPSAPAAQADRLWTWGFPEALMSARLELIASGWERLSYAVDLAVLCGEPDTGFSGCPVFTADGDLMGVITHIRKEAPSPAAQGRVFMVPVERMLGRRPHEPASAEPSVPITRMVAAERTDHDTCERLYDSLSSLPLADIAELWPEDRLAEWRAQPGVPDATAWDRLVVLWGRFGGPRSPSPPLLWVYHTFRHLQETRDRAVTTAVWQWLAERAGGDGEGQDWESRLRDARDHLRATRRSGGGPTPHQKLLRPPRVVVEVAPSGHGFLVTGWIRWRQAEDGRERGALERQHSEEVEAIADLPPAICRMVASCRRRAPRAATGRMGFPLRIVVPQALLPRLDLAEARAEPDREEAMAFPARYEVVYHLRDRLFDQVFSDHDAQLWHERSAEQLKEPVVSDSTTFFADGHSVGELPNLLGGNERVSIVVLDTAAEDGMPAFRAAVYNGIPTLVVGGCAMGRELRGLAALPPGDRMALGDLPEHIRRKCALNSEIRQAKIIWDNLESLGFDPEDLWGNRLGGR